MEAINMFISFLKKCQLVAGMGERSYSLTSPWSSCCLVGFSSTYYLLENEQEREVGCAAVMIPQIGENIVPYHNSSKMNIHIWIPY